MALTHEKHPGALSARVLEQVQASETLVLYSLVEFESWLHPCGKERESVDEEVDRI